MLSPICDKVLTIKHTEHPQTGEWYWEIYLFIAIRNQDGYYYWTRGPSQSILYSGMFPPLHLIEEAKVLSRELRVPYKSKLSVIRKTKPGSCMYFIELTPEEEVEFIKYANENDPDMDKWDVYHPVCRKVWEERGFRVTLES